LTAGSGQEKEENDARWREAAALRVRFRSWVVVWLAPESCFRAYRRSSNARRVGDLTAPSSVGMADLINQADANPVGRDRRKDPGCHRSPLVDGCPISPT
jgi:hypothetical protein